MMMSALNAHAVKERRARGRNLLLIALLLGAWSYPTATSAQSAAEVLAGIRNAGGWVALPIVSGVGTSTSNLLPAMGMTLEGCAHVWPGHSGTFEIRAHDTVADTTLLFTAEPGEGVPFRHTFGSQAKVDFQVTWSEPRDTTLMVWVGLAIGKSVEESCQPKYGG